MEQVRVLRRSPLLPPHAFRQLHEDAAAPLALTNVGSVNPSLV